MTDLKVFVAEFWNSLTDLQAALYPVALLAALALLSGALWIRSEHRQRHWQRDRDDERDVAAELKRLRREVCLPAAEAIARAQAVLAKFASAELDREDGHTVIDQVVSTLGKVHVIGGERAIKAAMAFSTEFSVSFMALSARKQPIRALQRELEHLDSKIAQIAYERDHLLNNITRLAGERMEEAQGLWNDMNLRFDRLHRQVSSCVDERAEKAAEQDRLTRELELEAAACALKVAKLGIPAYLAIREELELPIDEEEYRILAHANIAELERAVERLRRLASGEQWRTPRAPLTSLAAVKSARANRGEAPRGDRAAEGGAASDPAPASGNSQPNG